MTEMEILHVGGGGTLLVVGIIIGFLANIILNKILAGGEDQSVSPASANVPPVMSAPVAAYQADKAHIAAISAAVAEYRKNNL